ncbi:threonine--tRNA ligase [Halodesulfurarchaeum sp. HSR-GB]|uniref:threonine--tRNA ligase n=1 Tax=Halodesulfurarchaeum sp. HSR-GB TaxID=3074077 RepID=UPI002857C987|nr:threonine--tRNA ligase [Halodesulfurarchaeum sp. HSR-GB]MDR5655895.1 threonine--tRNA ligase [Halodesulfurarchaeum sp. HSR-GB]
MSTVTITLPDGSELEVESGATVEDVAYEIGPGLGRDTVAGRVDGELVAKEEPIEADAELQIVTEGSEDYLEVLRHTASHVFAQALQRIHPEAKLAIGPATDEGFYYDVDGVELDQDDLRAIQAEMEAIIEADYDVERVELSRNEALEFYEDNPYKQEILEDEAAGEGPISFYRQDDWQDLCKGPHVSSTGAVGAVELLNVSAAYWRGDEDRATLTRVYGTAFPDQDELEDYLEKREQAKERDHRRLGTELELFSIPDVTGPGLPLYHPNGKTVLRELESYVTEMNLDEDYDYVETPHLFRTELWKQSGHYDNYVDDMFLLDVNDEEYGLKPMNCPGHAMIFDQTTWSYRDLPERYAEDGKVYRKEQRGELSGLSRVWAFTIDDGHLFVRPDQIEAEVSTIVDMIFEVLETFDLEAEVALATRPEKSVGSDEIWETAESQLREVLADLGLEYDLEEGDGAFYGPKIDFAFEDALGRTWDGPTVQLDFNMPERFDLTYTGADNEDHRPVMIHRALYGSYERFFMVLIEHFNGKFPLWLAPEQVRILPVSDTNLAYARSVADRLDEAGFRVEVEDRDWTVGKKIQGTHEDRVPYMLVLGDEEESAGQISVRDREEREEKGIEFESFLDHLVAERDERRIEPDFLAE